MYATFKLGWTENAEAFIHEVPASRVTDGRILGGRDDCSSRPHSLRRKDADTLIHDKVVVNSFAGLTVAPW